MRNFFRKRLIGAHTDAHMGRPMHERARTWVLTHQCTRAPVYASAHTKRGRETRGAVHMRKKEIVRERGRRRERRREGRRLTGLPGEEE